MFGTVKEKATCVTQALSSLRLIGRMARRQTWASYSSKVQNLSPKVSTIVLVA